MVICRVTHRMLLDTSSLMYRAFFALPQSIKDPEGHPVNAVHGYLDMVTRLLTEYKPDRLIHVYDADWRPEARVSAYPEYKAGRADDPEALPPQFELLRTMLDVLGMEQAEAPGWEADDAIAALAAIAGEEDRVDIVTGDRDLIQLVRDPVVRVLFTVKGVSQLTTFDEAGVIEKYGVPARRYVDYAILRGDPSDNLPGVKGVGEKTARTLVGAYPDLDALLHVVSTGHFGDPPKLASALQEASEYIDAVRQVVPVRPDVEVTVWRHEPNGAEAETLAERRGLKGPLRRLNAVTSDE